MYHSGQFPSWDSATRQQRFHSEQRRWVQARLGARPEHNGGRVYVAHYRDGARWVPSWRVRLALRSAQEPTWDSLGWADCALLVLDMAGRWRQRVGQWWAGFRPIAGVWGGRWSFRRARLAACRQERHVEPVGQVEPERYVYQEDGKPVMQLGTEAPGDQN
jgi:hypothetical protein